MLREMAPDERPRERLKLRGSSALSDGDLLAIILNTGIRGETVTDVSQRLLAHHGGLRGIFRLDVAELARVRGIGDAKAVRVKAALELGRRLAALSPEDRPQSARRRTSPTCSVSRWQHSSRSSCGLCCSTPSIASWARAPS